MGRGARDWRPCGRWSERDLETLARVVEACARTKLSVVAADERDTGRPRGAQPRAHVRARARVGHRLRARGATARRSRWACSSPCGSPSARRASTRRCGRRSRGCSSGRACRVASTARRRPSCSTTWAGTRSAAARAATSCCCARRATSRSSPRPTRTCCVEAIEELRRDDRPAEPDRGAARRQPRHARQARPAALRHAHPDRAGGPDPPLGPRARPRDELLPHELRGRVRRAPAPGARAGGRPAAEPGRLDPLQLCDPRRARDGGDAGGGGAPLRRRRARGMAPPVGDLRPRRGAGRPGKGPDGYREALEILAGELGVEPPRRHERVPPARRPPRAAGRGAGARPAAGQPPRQRPLPDRLHRDERRIRGGPGPPRVPDRLPLRRARQARGARLRARARPRRPARGGGRDRRASRAAWASTTRT